MITRRPYAHSNLAAIGHIAQVAGFYKTGHIARAASNIAVGSKMGAAGLAGVGLALGGIIVAAKLVEVGFHNLAETTSSLVGAIAQLGGAKGLQSMLVESVTNDKLANQARFAVAGDERLTKADLKDLTASLSTNASAGAFDQADWLKTIKEIGTITGKQKGLDKDTLTFLGQFANVGGIDVSQAGDIFGHLKAKNRSLSNEDIRDIMLAGHAIGQAGSFNISEIPDANKLMQLQGRIAGDRSDITKLLFATGSLVKEGGAGNLQTAGVQFDSFLKQSLLSSKHGDTHYKFNAANQLTNPLEALEYAVNTPAGLQSKYTEAGRSNLFKSNLSSQISERASEIAGHEITRDDFSPEAKAARDKVIEDLLRTGMSLEEFQKEVEQSITPQEQFRAAFNKISNNLEAQFLPIMRQMEPIVEAFADKLVEKAPEIGDYFTKLAAWLATAVQLLPAFIDVMGDLTTAVGEAVHWIMVKVGGHAGNLDEAKARKKEYKERLDAWQGHPGLEKLAKEAKENYDKAVGDIAYFENVDKFSKPNIKKMYDQKLADQKAEEEEREISLKLGAQEKASYDKWMKENQKADNSNHEEIMDMHKKAIKIHEQMVHHLAPQAPTPPSRSTEGY